MRICVYFASGKLTIIRLRFKIQQMSAEQHGEEHNDPAINLRECFKKDYERLQNERFLPNESVQAALDSLFLNRFGYTVLTSHRLFTVSFQPRFGLKGPGVFGEFFRSEQANHFALSIGRAYRFPDKELSQPQMNSRLVNESHLKFITGVNMRSLLALKQFPSFGRNTFTQIIPQFLTGPSTLLQQPIFLEADQATTLYKLVTAEIIKRGDGPEIKPTP